MKIATHNVEFLFDEGAHVHSGKEWNYTKELVDARVEHFSKLFSEINADVLLLQEVASKSVIDRIIKKTGIDYLCFFATPDQNGVGNVVLYKAKDSVCKSIPAVASLPVFVEGDEDVVGRRIWSRRDFVYLETVRNNRKLHIIGIHIKANFLVPMKSVSGEIFPLTTQIAAADGLIRSELFRFSQAKKVRELVDQILTNDPSAQIIVAGDFNAEEYNSVFRIIRGNIVDASDSLIVTSQKVEPEGRFSIFTKDRMRLIDHILISKSIESDVVSVHILNRDIPDNKDAAPNPTLVGSDHAPVVVELS